MQADARWHTQRQPAPPIASAFRRRSRRAYRVTRERRVRSTSRRSSSTSCSTSRHAGTLVTKEALLDALWPGANVTDNALAQAVSELRQALGDEAGGAAATSRPSRGAAIGSSRRSSASPAQDRHARRHPPSRRGRPRPIAVLDFTNVTGDAESAWLSAGIAETVSGDLRALGRFRVVDRWRVMEAVAPDRRRAARRRRRAARAGSSSIGSFQRNGERMRITGARRGRRQRRGGRGREGRRPARRHLRAAGPGRGAVRGGARPGGVRHPRAPTPARDRRASRPTAPSWKAGCASRRSTSASCRGRSPTSSAPSPIDARYALAYTGLANAEFASYESTRADERAGAAISWSARSRTAGRRCSWTTRSPRRTARWR